MYRSQCHASRRIMERNAVVFNFMKTGGKAIKEIIGYFKG